METRCVNDVDALKDGYHDDGVKLLESHGEPVNLAEDGAEHADDDQVGDKLLELGVAPHRRLYDLHGALSEEHRLSADDPRQRRAEQRVDHLVSPVGHRVRQLVLLEVVHPLAHQADGVV